MDPSLQDWQPHVQALVEQYRASVAVLDEQAAARIRCAIDEVLMAVRRKNARIEEAHDSGIWRALWRARDILLQSLAR